MKMTTAISGMVMLMACMAMIANVQGYCAQCGDPCILGGTYCASSPQGCTNCTRICNQFTGCKDLCTAGNVPGVTPSPNDPVCGDRCNSPCTTDANCNYGYGNTCTKCYHPPCSPWGCPPYGTCVTPSGMRKRAVLEDISETLVGEDSKISELADKEQERFIKQVSEELESRIEKKVDRLRRRQ